MSMFKRTTIIFLFIIIIASFLRLYQLGNVPPSPDWDEAALGYNAYSIMQTGRDEYGEFLPVVLRSFDDYKPALYAYLIIPFIKLFDLNIVTVRLPSAIFGILTVAATYLLVIELFRNRISAKNSLSNSEFGQKHTKVVALVTGFLLAISPWHIQFSRIAFESNVGLSLNIFSILFFIYGLRKPYLLIFSSISMALALYAYQSEKIFTPLLFLLLVIVFRNELFKLSKKYLFLFLFSGLIVALPIAHYTITNEEALTRAKGVSVFSIDHQFVGNYAKRNIINKEKNNVFGIILDNRRVLYAKFVLGNYLSHYDLNWLFIAGDQFRHHAPNMALLYIWELPFLLIGIYILIFTKVNVKVKLLIFGWFLITPVPAAFTTGVPHAVRTLNFLPTFQVFTAIGIISTAVFLKKYKVSSIKFKVLRNVLYTFFFILSFFNFLYYLDQYFVQQNRFFSQDWQYGYKEAIDYIKSVETKYDKIIVSNEPHLDQSYIFFLFYLKYPPALYQESQTMSGGFKEDHVFGKYAFRPIKWDVQEKSSRLLYVGRPKDFPDVVKVLKETKFLEDKVAIKIVEG